MCFSLHKKRLFSPTLLLIASWLWLANATALAQERVAPIFFWNCENFFDLADNTQKNDDDFTPTGAYHWTPLRYAEKRNNLAKGIIFMSEMADGVAPVLVGLAEVENDTVLRDLVLGTPLRNLNYRFVHYDSPDTRGIDCALLYREDRFRPFFSDAISVSDSANGFFSRDILRVRGILSSETGHKQMRQDTLTALVCHLPSKRGGASAEKRRSVILERICDTLRAEQRRHPSGIVILMGDFNADAKEMPLPATSEEFPFMDLSARQPLEFFPKGSIAKGSYNYQGNWSTIDRMAVSQWLCQKNPSPRRRVKMKKYFTIFAPEQFLLEDRKHMTVRVNRTYLGPRYQGGISDHLPVGIILE